MVMVAVRVPVAEGSNVTLMVQLPDAATLEPQVLVWAKSLALVPLSAMLETERATAAELLRVTV
jgi:glyceraldehyde-3-phosphate dehydrogenase/erythrose-4-phosphate dehydrogenase